MEKDLADASAEESSAKASFESLVESKKKDIGSTARGQDQCQFIRRAKVS